MDTRADADRMIEPGERSGQVVSDADGAIDVVVDPGRTDADRTRAGRAGDLVAGSDRGTADRATAGRADDVVTDPDRADSARPTTGRSDDRRRPEPGLCGPDSEAWRLNRESMLLLGAGPRALLLQIAHPAVAAGVDEHSDFRADPWARLLGTIRSYLTIVYGTTGGARAEIRRLNELHREIRGRGYAARDPELSLWVHATLIDSTIVANHAWLAPLSRARRVAFYAETRPIARAFGVPEARLPADLDAFEAYVAAMLEPRGPVTVSPVARRLANVIMRPPLAPLATWIPGGAALRLWLARVPASAYAWTLWPAVGLLPARVRDGYGLPWGARERLVSTWLVAGWRTWRPLLPEELRQMAQARSADRRMAP